MGHCIRVPNSFNFKEFEHFQDFFITVSEGFISAENRLNEMR